MAIRRNQWLTFTLVIVLATAVASLASHVAVWSLGIKTRYGKMQSYESNNRGTVALLHGSSIAYDGIDWSRVASALGGRIESWATAGSSPSEWEYFDRSIAGATETIIVVSAYDLNEHWLSDYRAAIVPFGDAMRDMRLCGFDKDLCKRILSQYPQELVRVLFPSAGRSDGVLVGLRAKLVPLLTRQSDDDSARAPAAVPGPSDNVEKLSEWPVARLQRRLALLEQAITRRHAFDGPKRRSLERLIRSARARGTVTIVVMPVSGVYRQSFLTPQLMAALDNEVDNLASRDSGVSAIRLDRLQALDDDALFADFVHLNKFGQAIATSALLERIAQGRARP
ncbi:MAG: hypothetical protein U1F41_15940 [Burkholderiales bacterium]